MTTSMMLLFPAFTLGCVLTEIRWIVRMRKLQGQVGSSGTLRESKDSAINLRAPVADHSESLTANEETVVSLGNLGKRLADETPTSPLRETPETLKS